MRERQRDTAIERERKREKEPIEMDANRNPHMAQRAWKKGFLAEARNPHPSPNLNLHILERPGEQ